jgi:hypothetical protein
MPISQVSRGVYVVSPAQVPKYKDTAAGEYTSVFTKERAKQWELAQKQALMNIEVGAKRYEQEMLAYRGKLKALDDQLLANQRDASDVRAGNLTAEDRARIAAARAVQDEQKERARREELKARTSTFTKGGTSTSTSTGTGGGGGTRAPSAPKVSDTDRQEIGGAIRESGGDPMLAVEGVESRRTGGTLVGGSGALSDAQNVTLIESLVDSRVADSGVDRATAKADILTELDDGGKGYIVDSVIRAEAPAVTPTAGAGGGTRTTTSTRAGQGFYKPYAGLGELPELTPAEQDAIVKSMSPADRTPELEFLALQRAALEKQRAALGAPTAPGFDFITDARDIAAGRFGPTQSSPAYRQRLATQGLLAAPEDVRAELLRQYRASLPVAPTAPVSAVPVPPAAAPAASAAAPVAAPVAAAVPPAAAPARFGESGMGESFPYEREIVAAESGTRPPAPPTAVTPAPTEGASLPLETRMLLANMGRELAPGNDRTMLEALANTRLVPPAALPRATSPVSTMQAPNLTAAAPESLQLRPDTSRAAELAALGVKPEGELTVPAGDKGEPDTSAARNTPPLSLPGRSPFPDSPRVQLEKAESAGRFATSVKKAEDVRLATKAGLGGEVMGVKQGGPPNKVTYLQNRIETALELKAKPDKLSRLTASGAGKVANDLYRANAAKGIPFQRTWEEITMTFNGNEDAMKKAHEIAIALDMLTKDTAPKE